MEDQGYDPDSRTTVDGEPNRQHRAHAAVRVRELPEYGSVQRGPQVPSSVYQTAVPWQM